MQVTLINGRCDQLGSLTSEFPVHLETHDKFTSADHPTMRGMVEPQHGPLIHGLLSETSLRLRATCATEAGSIPRRSNSAASQVPCILSITVYGPQELIDEIGDWFQLQDVYLQDPIACHFDVPYCNPHRLSSAESSSCPRLVDVVSESSRPLHFQDLPERPDILDLITGQDDLDETKPPRAIRARLHRHQKQALTFMLRREFGWNFHGDVPDLWEAHDNSVDRVFINRIDDSYQREPPQSFSGGLVADPMGLGKTLTMIALVAADLNEPVIGESSSDAEEDDWPTVNATLVIVPQPLLSIWEQQISEHVQPGVMRFCRHHGKERIGNIQAIERMNIVLTTYHTLSADWNNNDNARRTMFSVRWRRIILDEAHLIRNMKTRMARALCDLEARSRWAVTGTPIQNHLSDLSGLLKFLRAYPYDDTKRFDADFTNLWKAHDDQKAVDRLRYLANCLILRRSKNTIKLPARHDVKCQVEFSNDERKLYEDVRDQTIKKIEDALVSDLEVARSGIFVNFLQQIESMRLVCDLGLHYYTRHNARKPQDATDWAAVAQSTFDFQREISTLVCSQCSSILDMTTYAFEDGQAQDNPCYSRCLRYACGECSFKLRQTGHRMVCGHKPRCPIAFVSLDGSSAEYSKPHVVELNDRSAIPIPAKVKALISDLKWLCHGTKSVVFSSWRLTLDVVEAGLNEAGICNVRFDGRVSHAQRQPVLEKFRMDPQVNVLLITLQCGAVGLTLTEASRAYLMEPHWNPTVEEQALARIHRIGQTQEVTTIRFYIRDSFEEKIIASQDAKKNLANILLSSHDGLVVDNSHSALYVSSFPRELDAGC
jgi:SNF2 family DNA or RNA helicase